MTPIPTTSEHDWLSSTCQGWDRILRLHACFSRSLAKQVQASERIQDLLWVYVHKPASAWLSLNGHELCTYMCRHAFVHIFIPMCPSICSEYIYYVYMYISFLRKDSIHVLIEASSDLFISWPLIYNVLLHPTLATHSHGHTLELANTYNCLISEITNPDILLSNHNLLSFHLACSITPHITAPHLTRTYLLFPSGFLLSSLPSISSLDPIVHLGNHCLDNIFNSFVPFITLHGQIPTQDESKCLSSACPQPGSWALLNKSHAIEQSSSTIN